MKPNSSLFLRLGKLCSHTCVACPRIDVLPPELYACKGLWTYVDISIIVQTKNSSEILSQYCAFYGFGQIYSGTYSPLVPYEYFHCPRNPQCFTCLSLPPLQLLLTSDHFTFIVITVTGWKQPRQPLKGEYISKLCTFRQ